MAILSMIRPMMPPMIMGNQEKNNFLARLEGSTKYWQLSEPIRPARSFTISFKVKQIFYSGIRVFLGDDLAGATRFYIGSEGGSLLIGNASERVTLASEQLLDSFKEITWEVTDGLFNVYVDSILVYSNTNLNPRDATFSTLSQSGSYKVDGFLYDFKVYDGVGGDKALVNHIPLTNKNQGATQLPTVGTVSATLINYTGDEWEEL